MADGSEAFSAVTWVDTVVAQDGTPSKSYNSKWQGKKRDEKFPPTCKALLGLSCLEKGEESRKVGSQNKHKTKIDMKMS